MSVDIKGVTGEFITIYVDESILGRDIKARLQQTMSYTDTDMSELRLLTREGTLIKDETQVLRGDTLFYVFVRPQVS